ncbi:MAG: hypothetical protein PF569_02720 [Candidatus Woesearchaeota archaeon]|nr:hypothetical protein [Candidatus Woesearchaeota archaeon]
MYENNLKHSFDNLSNIFAKEALDKLIFEINKNELIGEKIFFVLDDEQIMISANSMSREYQSPLEVDSQYLNPKKRGYDFSKKLLNSTTMGIITLSENTRNDLDKISKVMNLNYLEGESIETIFGTTKTRIYHISLE